MCEKKFAKVTFAESLQWAFLQLVIAIPEIPISGFPEIPFFPKSRNSGIFQAKIPEIRDFHFLHYLL